MKRNFFEELKKFKKLSLPSVVREVNGQQPFAVRRRTFVP